MFRLRRPRRRLAVALLAPALLAVGSTADAQGGTVRGVVYDSLAGAPLAGATVQLVAADSAGARARTTVADSLGRFAFAGMPDGRYTVGFFHARLEELGLEPPLRAVTVAAGRPGPADLAIPGAARLRRAICGDATAADTGAALVLGVVRDPGDGTSAADVAVSARWIELSLTKGGMTRRVADRTARTNAAGWFALCDVPLDGVELVARRGANSTPSLQVRIPSNGVLARALYLRSSADTAAAAVGRLRGVVVASAGGRPLAGARVRLGTGPEAVADDHGAFTVAAALGTQMLEVRALGYSPERQPVDVVPDAAPMRVALLTYRAMLEAVRVTAVRKVDTRQTGFFDRQRSGTGHYITAEQIARRDPLDAKDLFKVAPMVRLERDGDTGEDRITMRGAFGRCAPLIYVDGQLFPDITADALSGMLPPKHVMGVEIYSGASAPAPYQRSLSADPCGVILIWSRW